MIFHVVPFPGCDPPRGADRFLAYVQPFDIVPQLDEATQIKGDIPEAASGMYRLKRSRRSDGSIKGDIIPLERLRVPVELTPRFGKKADRKLKMETSLECFDDFWLCKWYNKELFFALSQ